MKKLDLDALPWIKGSSYPAPFVAQVIERTWRQLGEAAGLTQFGVNLVRMPPGAWSSQRHWHTEEDEFIYVVDGELVLVTDAGEEILRAGDCTGFKAAQRDGHHLQNRSALPAHFLAIGSRIASDVCHYPDIDLIAGPQGARHKDGTPY